MSLKKTLKLLTNKLVPRKIKSFVKNAKEEKIDVLTHVYQKDVQEKGQWRFKDRVKKVSGDGKGLPLPPENLRMDYSRDDKKYKRSGSETAKEIRSILDDYNVNMGQMDRFMEWGCATGRVLRQFSGEAMGSEVWGVDQHERSIRWNKENLSPPFRFLTCTDYPYLPFEDQSLDLVYGISVFTHIEHLIDSWLMEIRRILREGGHAIFTVHDENSINFFKERGKKPFWMPDGLQLSDVLEHDVCIVGGQEWHRTYTIFHTDWIRKEWDKYFDVLEIRPQVEHSQSAVVLRK